MSIVKQTNLLAEDDEAKCIKFALSHSCIQVNDILLSDKYQNSKRK